MRFQKMFTYIGVLSIILLVFGLAGWYFFLSRATTTLEEAALARGFNISVPSFLDSRGSTAANIETGFVSDEEAPAGNAAPPRLWKVSASPVAGMDFVGASSSVRFIERSTGQIFDADLTTGVVTRRTNTLTPKIYEAHVGGQGTIVKQTIEKDVLITDVGVMATTTDENGFSTLSEKNLGVKIRDIATSRLTGDILFLVEAVGETHLVRAKGDGSSPKQLLSLFVGGFDIHWLSDRIILKERGGSGVPSNAYVAGDSLIPLVRNVPGLTVLPRASSTTFLYGSDNGTSLTLFAQPALNVPATLLSIATIADKCVWADGPNAYCAVPQSPPPQGFLDAWYRGAAHTSDRWYRVDTSSGSSKEFFTPGANIAIDVERPLIDDTGEYLAFMNARDKSLWVLRLKEN
jgi:hypothetical protein